MSYETLLFDIDDTLLDFQAGEQQALQATFAQFSLPFVADIVQQYKTINASLWAALERGEVKREQLTVERFERLFHAYNWQADAEAVDVHFRQQLKVQHQLLGDSLPIVQDLSQRYDLYIVTNGIAETQQQRLTAAGLMPYFKELFISEAIGHPKPKAAFFDYVFATIPQFNAEKTMIIGDSLSADIKGGNDAGITTVWLNTMDKMADQIIPTHEITTLSALYPILA